METYFECKNGTKFLVNKMQKIDVGGEFLEVLENLFPTVTVEAARGVFIHRSCIPGFTTLLAVIPLGRIVGTASYFLEPKFREFDGEPALCAHIEDVAVSPKWQGQGIGQVLVEECLRRCFKEGAYKAILDCDPSLRSWYEKLGFYQTSHHMRIDAKPNF